jgi:hypothetical protein
MKCGSNCTTPKKSSSVPKSANSPKSLNVETGPCVPCIHPFEYLIEQAYVGISNKYNSGLFINNLIKLLERGINFPNCKYCCPDCEGVYVLGSVEEFLDFATAVGLAVGAPPAINPTSEVIPFSTFGKEDGLECCSNVYASTDTLLDYNEMLGLSNTPVPALPLPTGENLDNGNDNPFIKECCNGFSDCIEELTCWITKNSKNPTEDINTLLDLGIVEYGAIKNNCTQNVSSSICKLIELFDTYQVGDSNHDFKNINRIQLIIDLMQKGIVISCDAGGSIQMASIETWLNWADASGYTYVPV